MSSDPRAAELPGNADTTNGGSTTTEDGTTQSASATRNSSSEQPIGGLPSQAGTAPSHQVIGGLTFPPPPLPPTGRVVLTTGRRATPPNQLIGAGLSGSLSRRSSSGSGRGPSTVGSGVFRHPSAAPRGITRRRHSTATATASTIFFLQRPDAYNRRRALRFVSAVTPMPDASRQCINCGVYDPDMTTTCWTHSQAAERVEDGTAVIDAAQPWRYPCCGRSTVGTTGCTPGTHALPGSNN